MAWLILGLVLFLGVHAVRIVADDWRTRTIARIGEQPWKGAYTLVSLAGFGLIIWGFGQARLDPVLVWQPPLPMRHIAALLMLVAFIFLAASKVPGNAIKARLQHPMLIGTKVWALAHLLANGRLADLVLFGSFLVWAVLCFRAARQRDRANPPAALPTSAAATGLTVVAGALVWAVFAFWAHVKLFGVSPLGM
ncbi:MAG: hypothetical protein RI920_2490 [Pseudomonadota bacterium]|jgi:uncharacterized membrane protein